MTVEKVKAALPAETTFLGFAGSPWPVATYMVAGQGSREQAEARRYAYRDPEALAAIIDAVADMPVDSLSGQVRTGVAAAQLFDSGAVSLAHDHVEPRGIAPSARCVSRFRTR